ncbi:hypothetical protein [Carboxylicivirga taeanensis]|uniref:hypothetical protein n=1 Tax=Carboxylicivirga taeanensis TaxID=1416875 RepID=UPI003F6E2968
MNNVQTIKLETLNNQKEKEILALLSKNKECIYGEIIRQTNLSYSKGKELIFSLISRGYIQYKGRTTKLELAVEVL